MRIIDVVYLLLILSIPFLILCIVIKIIDKKEQKEWNAFVNRMTNVAIIETNEKIVLARLNAGEEMTHEEIEEGINRSVNWGASSG